MANEKEHAVRTRAYELWHKEGCPEGRDCDHWHQAERELEETVPQEASPLDKPASASSNQAKSKEPMMAGKRPAMQNKQSRPK